MRSIEDLVVEICKLSGHLNAANHRLLVSIAEFDRRTGWPDGDTQSCAHRLHWKCIAMGAAREELPPPPKDAPAGTCVAAGIGTCS
jgi:hypothetical protein